jgi:hypothetical protein
MKMPETDTDIAEIFIQLKELSNDNIICILEKVHSMPGQGVSSTFTFGENFGTLKGVLRALRIPTVLVNPKEWQKLIPGGLPAPPEKKPGETEKETSRRLAEAKKIRKEAVREFGQRVYPHLKLNLQCADAVVMLWTMDKMFVGNDK